MHILIYARMTRLIHTLDITVSKPATSCNTLQHTATHCNTDRAKQQLSEAAVCPLQQFQGLQQAHPPLPPPIYIHIYKHIYVYMHTYTYRHKYTCTRIYISYSCFESAAFASAFASAYICLYMYIYIYIHIYKYVWNVPIHIYINMLSCIYIHICTYTGIFTYLYLYV